VEAAPAVAVAEVVADAVALVLVADAARPVGGADRVAARAARAAHAAAVAVDGVKARAVIAKADAEMAEASSSRT
jgi:hypothetical protein